MGGIKLLGVGHCLPEQVMTNDAFAKIVDTSDEWIRSRTGIGERHFCREESHGMLCERAARQALKRAGIAAHELGVVIVATMTPDYITPSAACLLQSRLGLDEDTICFDLNAACSGFVYGLYVMECLLAACPKKTGLIVGAEVLSRLLNFEDRSTCVLFGDGAGAAVVKWSEKTSSICARLGARGDDQTLFVPGVQTGRPSVISMKGAAVFRFAVEALSGCITQVLSTARCRTEEVDHFVFHQANERIIDAAVKRLGLSPDKCSKNVDHCGNTSAASIPILLSELWERGKVLPGERILCVGFGGGLSWGGALIEMEDK